MKSHAIDLANALDLPPRAICPECGHTASLGELMAAVCVRGLAHCPRCEIGSPAAEWREPGRPRRIQLRRTKGWRLPANTINVARPSKWGNPFRVYCDPRYQFADALQGVATTRAAAVRKYRAYLNETIEGRMICFEAKHVLRGKHLACWCPPGEPCHADVLLQIANAETSPPKNFRI